MSEDYLISENLPSDDSSWLEWKNLIESEGWLADDLSHLILIPRLATTNCVVAKDRDGKLIGSVVWNDNDNVSFLGSFIVRPDSRGKGIGKIIWNIAMKRLKNQEYVILCSGPNMKSKYQSGDFPFETYSIRLFSISCKDFIQLADGMMSRKEGRTTKLVSTLSTEDFNKLLEFDKDVVGRDRSEFLKRYYELDFTEGCVLLDGNDDVIASAAICPTSTPDRKMFKLSPVYATSLEEAMIVVKSLLEMILEKDADSTVLFYLLTVGIGSRVLTPIFEKHGKDLGLAYTLMNKEYNNPIDLNRVFISHTHSGFFDA